MICPHCHSTSLVGPQNDGSRSRPRISAIMSCRKCSRHFDAYTFFGASDVATALIIATGLAA